MSTKIQNATLLHTETTSLYSVRSVRIHFFETNEAMVFGISQTVRHLSVSGQGAHRRSRFRHSERSGLGIFKVLGHITADKLHDRAQ